MQGKSRNTNLEITTQNMHCSDKQANYSIICSLVVVCVQHLICVYIATAFKISVKNKCDNLWQNVALCYNIF